ncbi:MAG TPA: DUF2283 domain-containing protein [Actinoplanes sp.]|nr:DUF2283 domain-containing protein [Actinoplanes sp.]
MRVTHDREANAAYLAVERVVPDGAAVENVVVERPGRGDIVLDFDADGRLLGVEVIGADMLLSPAVLAAADENRTDTRPAADEAPGRRSCLDTDGNL